ncbi:MAG: 4'-phosphopantetheinyl transferase superfamily protein [Clostridiales bacterium]|nr:4'-phosphopantetheinyl transferase superfamily protein [Clostridiales bacterium]
MNIEKAGALLAKPARFCSKRRLASCARIKDEARRMQGYAAELAFSYALSGDALLPPVYRYEESGRPVTDKGFVSLAHSGGFAVCALSSFPVGVDIEAPRTISQRAVSRILSAAEREEFAISKDESYPLRRFVMKEAFFKMTGAGLSGGLSRVTGGFPTVFLDGAPAGFALPFTGEGYTGSVVSSVPFEAEIILFPSH